MMIIKGINNEIFSDRIGEDTILYSQIFVGKRATIGNNCKIANGVKINSDCKIGNGTNIQDLTVLNSGTKIGRDCLISDHVATADERYPTPKTNEITRTPCEIGDNVMVGANATLVCCKIGDNSIIGAGSVVLHDVPPNMVYAGNPAQPIMTRDEFDIKQRRRERI